MVWDLETQLPFPPIKKYQTIPSLPTERFFPNVFKVAPVWGKGGFGTVGHTFCRGPGWARDHHSVSVLFLLRHENPIDQSTFLVRKFCLEPCRQHLLDLFPLSWRSCVSEWFLLLYDYQLNILPSSQGAVKEILLDPSIRMRGSVAVETCMPAPTRYPPWN